MVVAVATMDQDTSLDKFQDTSLDKLVATFTTKKQVLLATALILTTDTTGRSRKLRLIDSDAQGSLITAQAADLLQYVLYKTKNEIAPLGGSKKKCSQTVTLTLRPHFNPSFECETEFYVMHKLTRTLPDESLNTRDWSHLKGLQFV